MNHSWLDVTRRANMANWTIWRSLRIKIVVFKNLETKDKIDYSILCSSGLLDFLSSSTTVCIGLSWKITWAHGIWYSKSSWICVDTSRIYQLAAASYDRALIKPGTWSSSPAPRLDCTIRYQCLVSSLISIRCPCPSLASYTVPHGRPCWSGPCQVAWLASHLLHEADQATEECPNN